MVEKKRRWGVVRNFQVGEMRTGPELNWKRQKDKENGK